MQVFKDADGDDPDSDFEDPEVTSPSSSVTYRVIIDSDSTHPVTIVSLSDDIYDPVICKDSSDVNVVGQLLAADDGDGAGPPDGGDDEITCTFVETAPSSLGACVVDTVTVVIEGSSGQGSDSATVKTTGGAVGGVVDLRVTSDGSPQSASPTGGSTTARGYGLLAAATAAAAFMAAMAAWYAWRRSPR